MGLRELTAYMPGFEGCCSLAQWLDGQQWLPGQLDAMQAAVAPQAAA
jgi:hypothetical protein